MSPINDIKSDLLEAQILYANPFVLTTEKLLQIAELIHKYFPSVDSISCFARITDSANKTNKELVHLSMPRLLLLFVSVAVGKTSLLLNESMLIF